MAGAGNPPSYRRHSTASYTGSTPPSRAGGHTPTSTIAAGIMGIGELPSQSHVDAVYAGRGPDAHPDRPGGGQRGPAVAVWKPAFAADSTGFGTTIRDEMWADAKWGDKPKAEKRITGTVRGPRAHFLTGVRTNVITAAYVTHSLAKSGDAPQLPKLLYATNRHFDIEQVYADGAYSSGKNLQTVIDLGARAYIPFRSNSVYHSPRTKAGQLWNRLLTDFREREDEFYAQYHKRSNVESTNSGVKRLFGHLTRSKHPVARVNEVSGSRRGLQHHQGHTRHVW